MLRRRDHPDLALGGGIDQGKEFQIKEFGQYGQFGQKRYAHPATHEAQDRGGVQYVEPRPGHDGRKAFIGDEFAKPVGDEIHAVEVFPCQFRPVLRQRMIHRADHTETVGENQMSFEPRHMADAGDADIGIASVGHMPGFERHLVFTDRFGVVCPVDHPLAQNWSELTWKDLDGVDFIANGLCDFITDEGFAPIMAGSRLNVLNTASILSLVRGGVGVTLLPELAVLPEFLDLEFLPLVDASAQREVWMVTPPQHMLTPAAQALTKAILDANIPVTHD